MRTLSRIGRDLYNYFLSIYPEYSTISLCMSENLFYQFVNEYTNNNYFVQQGFINIDLKDSYACLVIAVYQSTLFVRKNMINTQSYNKELCNDINMTSNSLQDWYKNNQEKIWTDIIKKLFKNKKRNMILPESKTGAYRYVQYPSSQFIINSGEVQFFENANLNFDEYSKRFFYHEHKYYDSSKEYFDINFYNYSTEDLNYIAKRIIYSFVVNDIKFIKSTKVSSTQRPPQKKQNKIATDNNCEQLHLRIQNNKIIKIGSLDSEKNFISFLDKHFFKLFVYDHKNMWWSFNTSRKIDNNKKYGIYMQKSFFEYNNDSYDYIKNIYSVKDYYFIEVNENRKAIKEMCNLYHFIYNLNINFSFIGGLRNKNNEYYLFSLPIIKLNRKADTLYINNTDINVSSDTYNLNQYKDYLIEGSNTFTIEPTKIYKRNIIIKNHLNESTNIIGANINTNDYSISYSYPYHIQGIFVSNNIPQIMKKENNDYLFQYHKPIFNVINSNLKSQLNKGKINVI